MQESNNSTTEFTTPYSAPANNRTQEVLKMVYKVFKSVEGINEKTDMDLQCELNENGAFVFTVGKKE